MITSIATVSLSSSLPEKLEAIAQAGFAGCEIFENDLIVSAMSPEEVRDIVRDLGLAITVYQPFRDFEGLSGHERERAFDRAERKFDLMTRLGTDLMLVCSSVRQDSSADHTRIAADLRALGERAAARGMRIAYEGLAWGAHVRDHREVAGIAALADHPAVGMVLDSFHSLSLDIPISSLRLIDPNKLFLVQLADAPRLSMDVLQWSRHYRCLPGQGDFPQIPYVAALQEMGYAGPLSLEIFNDRFRSGATSSLAVDGLRSLRFVQDAASRLRGASVAVPARPEAQGIRFVEIAVSTEEAERLSNMFRAMGLRCAGRHRTLDVTRWSAGGVDLLLNCESSSFASSFEIVHGASICAIGVAVSDVAAAVERADAMRIASLDDGGALAASGVPALRGIGGSLIYLLGESGMEPFWRDQFIATAEAASPAAPLGGIDHLGAVMVPSELLSWRLFWTALFPMHATQEVDVFDPAGVVQSQAVETENGSLRITLSGTGGPGTLSARFVHTSFGAGFQHLAFATDDIFAASAAMRARGLPILPIPANYYDDLAARFGLPDAEIARLRENDILLDVDSDGRMLHQFFSRAFDKRFFFEFVQRDGYRGYGAANAMVRLAAQARFVEKP